MKIIPVLSIFLLYSYSVAAGRQKLYEKYNELDDEDMFIDALADEDEGSGEGSGDGSGGEQLPSKPDTSIPGTNGNCILASMNLAVKVAYKNNKNQNQVREVAVDTKNAIGACAGKYIKEPLYGDTYKGPVIIYTWDLPKSSGIKAVPDKNLAVVKFSGDGKISSISDIIAKIPYKQFDDVSDDLKDKPATITVAFKNEIVSQPGESVSCKANHSVSDSNGQSISISDIQIQVGDDLNNDFSDYSVCPADGGAEVVIKDDKGSRCLLLSIDANIGIVYTKNDGKAELKEIEVKKQNPRGLCYNGTLDGVVYSRPVVVLSWLEDKAKIESRVIIQFDRNSDFATIWQITASISLEPYDVPNKDESAVVDVPFASQNLKVATGSSCKSNQRKAVEDTNFQYVEVNNFIVQFGDKLDPVFKDSVTCSGPLTAFTFPLLVFALLITHLNK